MRYAGLNANRMLLLSILSLSVIGPTAVQAAIDRPAIVRGTISSVAGNTINVTEKNGQQEKITLTNDAKIAVVNSASLSDIKPDSYIGVAAKPNSDGTLEALEVHVFPSSMRGVGEGTRDWDLGANSSMTNGTVAKVDSVAGGKVTVNYRGGEKTISIAPSTKVVALAPGDRDELKPGTKAFIPIAGKQPDGTLQASRITVGSGNAAPPM
jgi:Domain of unknown function (DUF5666)